MKGLLMVPQMALAACEERKKQTRRVMSPQPIFDGIFWNWSLPRFREYSNISMAWGAGISIDIAQPWDYCEYRVGERRCLLTTWAARSAVDDLKPSAIPPIASHEASSLFWHAGMSTPKPEWAGINRAGRFLPNHLRHLMPVFEIVSVRAERVQDATSADIVDEGITYPISTEECPAGMAKPLLRVTGPFPPSDYLPTLPGSTRVDATQMNHDTLLRAHWASLWDSINHERGFGWQVNPWVWRVAFRRVEP